jgi:hypothetical protein
MRSASEFSVGKLRARVVTGSTAPPSTIKPSTCAGRRRTAEKRFSKGAVTQLASGEYSIARKIRSMIVEIVIPARLVLLNQDRAIPAVKNNSPRSLGLVR